MKEIEQYGLLKDEEWEVLPWIPNPRPPFIIRVKPEELAPFFLVEHHPYAISVLLRMDEGFQKEVFQKFGREGTSKDWERLTKKLIEEYERDNSGEDLFHFDSDEDIFCVYSQYVDDLLALVRWMIEICKDEEQMRMYLE